METNLNGTMRACRVFGRHMIDRKYGRIINIASIGSFVALYEVAPYNASKAGVAALTKLLAIRMGDVGRMRERDRTRRGAHGIECGSPRRYRARQRIPDAHPHAAFWEG